MLTLKHLGSFHFLQSMKCLQEIYAQYLVHYLLLLQVIIFIILLLVLEVVICIHLLLSTLL